MHTHHSVSYTHLDVYKRQVGVSSPPPLSVAAGCFPYFSNEIIRYYIPSPDLSGTEQPFTLVFNKLCLRLENEEGTSFNGRSAKYTVNSHSSMFIL